MEVPRFHQQGPIWPVVLTGLIGVGQWGSSWCSVAFSGLWSWLLVPRASSTPVAAWSWPTWVVSRRRVLEVVFILLEPLSPSRRIFIGSHSLPPPLLLFAVSVLHYCSCSRTRMSLCCHRPWKMVADIPGCLPRMRSSLQCHRQRMMSPLHGGQSSTALAPLYGGWWRSDNDGLFSARMAEIDYRWPMRMREDDSAWRR
jgi:hypothetical protein